MARSVLEKLDARKERGMSTTGGPKEDRCHGCGGSGWVETKRGAERCPICHGRGRVPHDSTREPLSTITW